MAPYDEIKKQIREFLYSQMEEDRAISSCIIIHTCNKNKEKVCCLGLVIVVIVVIITC